MLSNYFKIALRTLVKHKAFSFINIVGLALSMTVCLLFMSMINDAHSYDRFHPEAKRTYRIITEALRKDGGSESYASSPFPVGRSLSEDYSQVELWTPLVNRFSGEVQGKEDELYLQGLFTDNTFFEMFGFTLAAGDPKAALSEPYSVVLTKDWAQKLFDQDDNYGELIGKTIAMPAYETSFKITGVLNAFPGKSHLEFDALGSLATQLALEKEPDANLTSTEWRDYYATYNFVRLKDAAKVSESEHALDDIAQHKLAGLELESRDKGYRYSLQALNDITPGRILSQSMGRGLPALFLWFLSALGLIIMLTACFNYTNLTVARSLIRAKEVGVRKVLGAKRSQVFWQLIGEAIMTSLISLGLSLTLVRLLVSVNFIDAADAMQSADWKLYGMFLLFAIGVGFIAGVLPAAALSKTSPLQVLQKLQNIRLIQRIGLRKVLLSFQFTVTLVFLFLMTLVWRQVDYGMKLNFGFDQPQTLLVEMGGVSYSKLSAAFANVSGVENVSAISHSMGTWQDSYVDVRTDSITERTGARDYIIDHNYLDHFSIKLTAGENFPENLSQQHELFAIVNEIFCAQFKLGDPSEAIGKTLTLGDSTHVIVRGVVEDFFFKPSTYAIEPLVLRYDLNQLHMMNLELSSEDIPLTIAALERTWSEIEKSQPLSSQFYDVTVRQNYEGFMSTAWMVGILGVLGMVIACMGLLGMAIYTVETRTKEVGIRKVMGAEFKDIIVLLSKGYFIVLLIAIAIAAPLSFLIGGLVLQEFAQRAPWSIYVFLPGVVAILVFAGLTIGSQTFRAALSSPVESLRSE